MSSRKPPGNLSTLKQEALEQLFVASHNFRKSLNTKFQQDGLAKSVKIIN
jgi:hypothetical protein